MTTDHVAEDGAGLTTLVAGIISDGQELIRQQLHLFQVELKNDLKRTSNASIPIVVGGILAGMGAFLLLVMVALLLHAIWPAVISLWGGFGIVAAILLVGGGACLLYGKKQFDAFNPLPDKTVEGLKENVQWKTKT
ncbi:MAG: phage holin family protein [Gemmataceae bacterium]